MAEGKKSFLLYCDIAHTVEHLADEQAGKLFKHIVAYVNDKNPETEDLVIRLAFEPIKQQLKRDLKRWGKTRKERSAAGKRGMAKRWGEPDITKDNKPLQTITKDNTVIDDITKITVNDNVTVNVNDTVSVKENRERDSPTVFYNAESEILKNQIWIEKVFAPRGISMTTGKEILRNYHLYLTEKEKYPMSRRALFAGFERWINNEKKFNGTHQQHPPPSGKRVTKSTGAENLARSLGADLRAAGLEGT